MLAVFLLPLMACGPATDSGLENATISIVIPYRAGGGFDSAMRLFAPYFAREIGPGVTILPENMPGAGGRRGAALVFRSRPDGRVLGIYNLPGFVLPEVLGEKVDYDLRELSWIGRIEWQPYVLLVAANSGLQSLDDVRSASKVTFLSTGYGSSVLAASQISASRLQLADSDPVYLAGYAGTADCMVGLIRGDGNVALVPVSSAMKYIQSGDLRPLAVAGEESILKDVLTFKELGYPELAPLGVQRSIAGPPGMAPERLQQLRDAFDRAIADPDFVAAARKASLDLQPLDGAATSQEVADSFTFYESFKMNLGNPNAM
ncbi:MAG: tripartite tricarboxylate transporter substrate binding protein [Woeseiaceae bacterium]|nr:tripartite tricarboxylate transporter substrate binding protein [Woeseiaceae bacterium]